MTSLGASSGVWRPRERWLLMCLLAAGYARAGEPSATAAMDRLGTADSLHASGHDDEALQVLKLAHAAEPESQAIVLALAQAYVRAQNDTWAARVLGRFLDRNPQACPVRLQLAWLRLRSGLTRQSRMLLEEAGCDAPPEIRARRLLLFAYLDVLAGDVEHARVLVNEARSAPAVFEEDVALLAHLGATTQPARVPTATGHIDLANGWTSNGLAGSPLDQVTPRDAATPITLMDARLRVVAPGSGAWHPLAEGQLRAQQLWAEHAADLSFRTGMARAGLLWSHSSARLAAVAVVDATQVQGGDRYATGPIWFSGAQRAELELELPQSLFVMTGLGQRRFREIARTRTEFDTTVGWGTQLGTAWKFLGGISARYHDATNKAFDLLGLTAVSQVRRTLPAGFESEAVLSVAVDSFPRSQGYFFSSNTSTRRDVRWRATAGLYSPQYHRVRVSARYEATTRVSSAAAYEFTDHRLLLSVLWRIDSDEIGRKVVGRLGRVPIDYGALASQTDSSNTQLRDLMRQEETQRRSSTCLR